LTQNPNLVLRLDYNSSLVGPLSRAVIDRVADLAGIDQAPAGYTVDHRMAIPVSIGGDR